MRLWVREEDRHPDPEPVRSDGRKPAIVGTLAWLVALVVALVTGAGWLLATSIIGIVLGIIGFVVVLIQRRRR